jgi:hypothetical protein
VRGSSPALIKSGTEAQKNSAKRKIFVAPDAEKFYYRFCGYGNYENTHLSLRPVIRLLAYVDFDGFRLRHRPPKGSGRDRTSLDGAKIRPWAASEFRPHEL